MASIDPACIPWILNRRATSRAENPQSMSTVVCPSLTAVALPDEPEPRNAMRSARSGFVFGRFGMQRLYVT